MKKINKKIFLLILLSFLLLPNLSYAKDYCECTVAYEDPVASTSNFYVITVDEPTTEAECQQYPEKIADGSDYSCKWISESDGSPKAIVSDLNLEDLNQLKASSPEQFIGLVIKTVMGIIGTIALIMIIYGGFLWMTNSSITDSNKKTIFKAKQVIVWAVLGLVMIFFSYAILNTIFDIFI